MDQARGAATWTQLIVTSLTPASNVPVGGPHTDYQAMVVDAAGGLLVATDGGLYRSPDPVAATPTWQHIGQTMHINEPLAVAYDTLAGIAMSGSADNGVAYQQGPGQLRWRSLAGGDGGGVAVDDTAADHSWRYFMNFSGGTGPGGFVVYRAGFDAGNRPLPGGGRLTLADPATPTVVSSGILDPDKTQNAIRATPSTLREVVLVGTSNGLFRTTTADAGTAAHWKKIGNLPHAAVQDMKYHPNRTAHPGGDVLVVGLQGRGAWTLTDATSHL